MLDPNLDLQALLALSKDMLAISIIISVVCAALCGVIASRRQVRVVYWSVMGFVFGPFALPFVFMAKKTVAGEQKLSAPSGDQPR